MQESKPGSEPQDQSERQSENPWDQGEPRHQPKGDENDQQSSDRHRDQPVDPSGESRGEAYSVDQAQGLQDAEAGGQSSYSTIDPVNPDDRLPPRLQAALSRNEAGAGG